MPKTQKRKAPKPLSREEARDLVLCGDFAEQIDIAEHDHDVAALSYARMAGYKRDCRHLDAFREIEQTSNRREYLRGVHDGRVHALGIFQGAGVIADSDD